MIHNKPDENWMKLSDLKLLQFVHSMLSTSKMIRLVVMVTSCWALCTYTLVQYPFQDVFLHNQGQMDKQSFKAPIPSKAWQRTVSIEQDDTFSACLLVMDDNHFLVEWLAYHYYALPLRYLVVAVDPRSQTSPTPILDRYRNKEDGMTIIEWTDEDYMNDEELIEAEQKVRNQFGNLTSTLVRHRARQRLFYYKCMQKMKEEDRTWTLMTDTDEFLRVNYDNVKDTGLEEYGRIPRISEPASIRSVLHAELERPNTNLTKTPCIQIPRLRFGAVTSGKAPTGMLPEGWDNTDNFLTLFWRKHAGAEQYWANKISKVMIDVSQVNWEELVPVESIHRPIKSLCNKRKLHVRANESPLVINHYLGSYEQYVYRNDARQDEKKEGRTRAVSVQCYG